MDLPRDGLVSVRINIDSAHESVQGERECRCELVCFALFFSIQPVLIVWMQCCLQCCHSLVEVWLWLFTFNRSLQSIEILLCVEGLSVLHSIVGLCGGIEGWRESQRDQEHSEPRCISHYSSNEREYSTNSLSLSISRHLSISLTYTLTALSLSHSLFPLCPLSPMLPLFHSSVLPLNSIPFFLYLCLSHLSLLHSLSQSVVLPCDWTPRPDWLQ